MDTTRDLLSAARAAGLNLFVRNGRLVIRGRREHEKFVRRLLERQAEVITMAALTAEEGKADAEPSQPTGSTCSAGGSPPRIAGHYQRSLW